MHLILCCEPKTNNVLNKINMTNNNDTLMTYTCIQKTIYINYKYSYTQICVNYAPAYLLRSC